MISIAFVSLLVSAASAQVQEGGRHVRLVPPGAMEILDRVNRISKVCPDDGKTNAKGCREEKLAPRGFDLTLYSAPLPTAATGEKITIVAKPGLGLHALYFKKGTAKPVELVPDVFDPDWRTGPVFDFTVKSVKGEWIELPKGTFPEPVWINPSSEWKLEPRITPGSPASLTEKTT